MIYVDVARKDFAFLDRNISRSFFARIFLLAFSFVLCTSAGIGFISIALREAPQPAGRSLAADATASASIGPVADEPVPVNLPSMQFAGLLDRTKAVIASIPFKVAVLRPGLEDAAAAILGAGSEPTVPDAGPLAPGDGANVVSSPLIPLPAPRPSNLLTANAAPAVPGHRMALARLEAPANPPPGPQSILERLFGPSQPSGPALAYAAPDDGALRSPVQKALGNPMPYDRFTAVYDIAAHTVTLPDGTKLEAHSGLGAKLDDPRSVRIRMIGATPPNLYDLQLREQIFHGVRALRLTPAGSGAMYGRAGLLAHTYMLGPRGDSNGCVAFKNYQAFLQAFDSGQVKRLAVVERMN